MDYTWVTLTILSVIIWAIGSLIDKFVLSKYLKDPNLSTAFLCVFGLLTSITILFAYSITIPTIDILVVALGVGFLYSFVNLFYFKSLFVEEVSRVVPLFTLVPLFVLILAMIFLGETFTTNQYIGIVLLVIGAFAISWEHGETKFKLSKSFWFMILADIIFALPILGLKYELSYMSPETALFWAGIGMLLSLPIFIIPSYKRLEKVIKNNSKSILYVSISSLILMSGLYVMFTAADMAEITLISALGQTQMFFVLLFATIVSIFKPDLIKEEITKKVIIEKVISIVILFVGVVLIL